MPVPTRDNIEKLHAYVPGEQPTWRDTAHPDRPVIKLNTNENPYPPPEVVMQAIRDLPGEALRLYPPPSAKRFREAAAKAHGVKPENIIATNGGDELLRMIITAFCESSIGFSERGGVGVTRPTYSLYPVLAAINDSPVCEVWRTNENFGLPSNLARQWNNAGVHVGFLVNPHAPTGQLESVDALRRIAEELDGLLVVDEAYVDFAEYDALELVKEGRDDVLLLRSLSKGYSLAGLRFGYGIAHERIVALLDKVRDSYNTDILSQVAATAAITHRDAFAERWELVKKERARLTTQLRQRGFVTPDSQSNFVLATPPKPGPDAKAIYEALKQRDILVRYFSHQELADRLRITIGTPEQDDALLAGIDAVLGS
jgi:histidinol-phosphate aminotransferase